MYSKILFTLLLHHLFALSLFSQEIKKGEVYAYARKIVDTMASESMHGRGYVNGGDSIAAHYLKNEFSKIGLKSFGSDYYQRMNFAINTFPGEILFDFQLFDDKASLERMDLTAYQFVGRPGENFLISPSTDESSGITMNFGVVVFDSTDAKSEKAYNKFIKKTQKSGFNPWILVDDRDVFDKNKLEYFKKIKSNHLGGPGVFVLVKKLTWSQSQEKSPYHKIEILKDSFKLVKSKNFVGYSTFKFDNKFIPNHPSQNVIGYVQGSVYPDSFIVYSAHYDHLGQMGKDVYFPGANDNASGCAMLLNLANYYSKPENKPKYSIAFMAFCGEEVGLLGSKYYTENPLFPLKNIKFVFNMDIMGTGEEGITVVNGTIFKTEFDKLKEINTQNNFIKDVKIRGKAANSDHYFFSEKGVKAFFIYSMGGIKAYHDIYDRPETLPLNEFENMFKLIAKFGDYLQQ